MKKSISIILIIAGYMAILFALSELYNAGYQAGITHVIEKSEIWIEEADNCLEICISVDGNVYIHEAE